MRLIFVLIISIIFFEIAWISGAVNINLPTLKTQPENVSDLSKQDIVKDSGGWSKEIDKVGVEEAYEEFKTIFKTRSEKEAHLALHVFSGLIYEEAGPAGIYVCDDSFSYACFHGFFTAAIAKDGKDVFDKLKQVCDDVNLRQAGCQHGLGHGLMEYYGENKLTQALDLCTKLSWRGKIFGCPSGVFMEFNFPILVKQGEVILSTRKFDPDNPYYPCSTVDSKFQASCYYELGQYLREVYMRDYGKIGEACAAVKDLTLKKYCFLGVGWYAPPGFNYDTIKIVDACGKMPSKDDEFLCKLGAVQQMSEDHDGSKLKISEICKSLEGESLTLCLSGNFYNLEGII
jgi:hypothetical protein